MLAEGQVVVAALPQADGQSKPRPVLLLRMLPGYGDFLTCGISTQLHQGIEGFDMTLRDDDRAFPKSGLKASSVIRLGFLAVVPRSQITRKLGGLEPRTLQQLQRNLATYLCKDPIA